MQTICKRWSKAGKRGRGFKKSIEEAVQKENVKTSGLVVGFVDEAGSRPRTSPRLWSFRKSVLVKSTTEPKVNIIGFYSVNGNSIIDVVDDTRTPSFCSFLELVRETNPGKSILVVLDNYKPHHVEMTLRKAKELGIILVHLPPYSPDLNPIEQVWRALKKQLTLLYILTREELIAAIREIYRVLSEKTSFANKWINTYT